MYYPERRDDGYHLVLAPVTLSVSGGVATRQVGTFQTTVSQQQIAVQQPIGPSQFTEYQVPVGSFPDQIDLDSSGRVWFSQPSNDFLTVLDPSGPTFTQYATTGGSGPDGMMVDDQDVVWTGLYFGGGLGRLDPSTGVHQNYPAPYGGAVNMAIPKQGPGSSLWVTDHSANRISRFDTVSKTWIGSFTMRSPGSHVVEGAYDPSSGFAYFTQFNVNKLAYTDDGTPILETSTPFGGPAFPVVSGGKVYYSMWSTAEMGEYDPGTGQHTIHSFPVAGENGGPIGATEDGRIVVGTRNAGYIMVFRPSSATFRAYKIPTSFPGLKDGLVVGPDDVVWFTESGANKIARLKLP